MSIGNGRRAEEHFVTSGSKSFGQKPFGRQTFGRHTHDAERDLFTNNGTACFSTAIIYRGHHRKGIAIDNSIEVHRALDGLTNPEYKLLRFIQLTTFFAERRRH